MTSFHRTRSTDRTNSASKRWDKNKSVEQRFRWSNHHDKNVCVLMAILIKYFNKHKWSIKSCQCWSWYWSVNLVITLLSIRHNFPLWWSVRVTWGSSWYCFRSLSSLKPNLRSVINITFNSVITTTATTKRTTHPAIIITRAKSSLN